MNKIVQYNELPEKEFIIETGMHHKIYLLSNGLKYKEYNPNDPSFIKSPYNKELIQSLKEQINTTSPLISFPTSIVLNKRTLYGTISKFETGDTLENIDQDTNIFKLLKQIYQAEIEIERLSKEGWLLDDINSKNIIVNTKLPEYTFKIIDTDYYVKRTDAKYEELIKLNRSQLMAALIDALIPLIAISDTSHNKKIYNYYLLAINGKIKPTEFFYELIELISKRNEISTVLELRKSL